MKKLLLVSLAVITVAFAYKIYTIIDTGLFRSVVLSNTNISWQHLKGTKKIHDLQIDSDQKTLFFSHTKNEKTGGISKVILPNDNTPIPLIITLKYKYTSSFNPKGISLWEGANGDKRLFVINNFEEKHHIDIFNIKDDSLIHLHSINSTKFISLNDIVAINSNSFYVSNDKGSISGFSSVMENFFKFPASKLLYYNGESITEVLNHLGFASGLAYDHRSHTLYLSETIAQKVYTYERYGDQGFLKETGSIRLPNPEKINLDHNGNLWVTCHPEINSLETIKNNPEALEPTQIIKLTPTYKGQFYAETIYSDPSPQVSPIVTAATQKTLWIGALSNGGIQHSKY